MGGVTTAILHHPAECAPADVPAAGPRCVGVELDLAVASKAEAIECLAALFAGGREGHAGRAVAAVALEREAQASTYAGNGVAIPHARMGDSDGIAFAVARLARPVAWTPADDAVRVVFLSVVPITASRSYLDFLRRLARAFHERTTFDEFMQLRTEKAAVAWIAERMRGGPA